MPPESTGLSARASCPVEEGDQLVPVRAPDGGPSPARVLKTHLALIAVPVVVLFPAAALLIPGAIGHSPLLRWLAVPVAIAWATLLSWRAAEAAARRLESRGPEILSAIRARSA